MADGGATLAIASIAATVISTGITAYSLQQQSQNASRIANYNAQVQQQNADINRRAAQMQIDAQHQQLAAQQQTDANNATVIQRQAAANQQQADEANRRLREQKLQFLGKQRAAYASAGVMLEGTPLAVLADSAGQFELEAADNQYKAEIKNRGLFYQAQMQKYGANVDKFRESLLSIDQYSASAARQSGYAQASLTKLEGESRAQGLQMQSYGTLISGAGSVAGQYSTGYNNGTLRYGAVG